MMKKLKNQKGFTLMEMLIVVAIIAVLVAIAIPTFSGALNKARAATDTANIRSGYADAQIKALTGEGDGTYYLKQDGTVGTTGADDYVTKAASTGNVTAGTLIGGQYEVNGDITWAAGNKIVYTVEPGTGDGLGTVTKIEAK